ncbi:hypothetical protein ACQJBY_001544 [Aegilops geniculata]
MHTHTGHARHAPDPSRMHTRTPNAIAVAYAQQKRSRGLCEHDSNAPEGLERVNRNYSGLPSELQFTHPKCLWQEGGNDFCGYYVCEFIRHWTCEQGYSKKQYEIWQMRDELLPQDRIRAIQEELAGFFLDHVINKAGEYHVEIDIEMRC